MQVARVSSNYGDSVSKSTCDRLFPEGCIVVYLCDLTCEPHYILTMLRSREQEPVDTSQLFGYLRLSQRWRGVFRKCNMKKP